MVNDTLNKNSEASITLNSGGGRKRIEKQSNTFDVANIDIND